MSTYSSCGMQAELAVESFCYPVVGAQQQINLEESGGNEACDWGQRERQARAEGISEGEARARASHEKALAKERESVIAALEDFGREREAYYRRVEGEVVQLALTIARKVLHREAQVDPLLLAGIVEVALRKLETNTAVRLRIENSAALLWREYIISHPDLRPTPELVVDGSISPGVCILETELGSTELGIDPQLKEIENGLFDLLAQRPGAKS